MLDRLRRVVQSSDTLAGLAFDIVIQTLILVSLVSLAIETVPTLSPGARRTLWVVEVGTVAIFTLEYLLRILTAEKPLRFMFSFFGLVDLLAIAPFYLTTGLDLRSFRAVRFLRLFRAAKLVRYNRAIRRFHRAFMLAREELALFFSVALLVIYIAGTGIYYFERDAQPEAFGSIPQSLWWAVATLTTVGYGDAFPITVGGRVFTFLVLMVGLGIVAVPSGMIAAALGEARRLENEEREASGLGSPPEDQVE
jgi:voltage-gated potassium channel